MKKFLFIATFITLCTTLAISCSEKEDLPQTPPSTDSDFPTDTESSIHPDSVLVSVTPSMYIDSEPLGTRASNNDLYALQVWVQLKPENGTGYYISTLPYAHGYFDDLSKVVLKLAKKQTYGFTVAYIPNGKNLLYQYPDGHYGCPCHTQWGKNGALNEIVYGDEFELTGLGGGVTQAKGVASYRVEDNAWNSIERYQGVVVDFDPNASSTVNIKLYRMMIGFKLDISDFHSGVVTIRGTHGYSYNAYPDGNGNGALDIVIETESMLIAADIGMYGQIYPDDPNCENKEQLNEYIQSRLDGGTTQVHITYTTDKGEIINLYNNLYFAYNRNTKYKFSFSLSDAIQNGGIAAEIVEDGDMKEEDFPL